jgi:transposase
MKEIYERCCGLDVHRDTIVVCILLGYGDSAKKEIQTFSTKTSDIKALSSWLKEHQIRDVVVESTGIYWKPIFNLFEGEFNLVLVNPYHVKNAKGRKTDVKDSEWLCRLFKAGAISASFIPPKPIRRLRELVRYRLTLVRERSRVKNRIIKTLENANIKLSSVFSDVFGYTSWLIVGKIISGERCTKQLTSYIHERVRASREEIQKALEGTLEHEDIVVLRSMIAHVGHLETTISQVEGDIINHSKPYEDEVELLTTIPGFSTTIATAIISEIGVDMSQFPTHSNLASWATVCPGNNESAGKQKSGRTRRGNNYLKGSLLQAAWAASRTKNTYLQSKYRAIAARKGSKKAAIAIAHKILVICYHMLKDKKEFHEIGSQFLDSLNAERKVKYHVQRLEELGYHVAKVQKVKGDEKELVFI